MSSRAARVAMRDRRGGRAAPGYVGSRRRHDDQIPVGNDEDELPAVAPGVIARRGRRTRGSRSRSRIRDRCPSAIGLAAPACDRSTTSAITCRSPLARRSNTVRRSGPSAAASSTSRCRRSRCPADPAATSRAMKPSGLASSSCANCHVLVFGRLRQDRRQQVRAAGAVFDARARLIDQRPRAARSAPSSRSAPTRRSRGRSSTRAPIASSADPRS